MVEHLGSRIQVVSNTVLFQMNLVDTRLAASSKQNHISRDVSAICKLKTSCREFCGVATNNLALWNFGQVASLPWTKNAKMKLVLIIVCLAICRGQAACPEDQTGEICRD